MNDQDWDDYAWQREGTVYGDQARRDNEAILNVGRGNRRRNAGARSKRAARPATPTAGEAAVSRICARIDDRLRGMIDSLSLKAWFIIGVVCCAATVALAGPFGWDRGLTIAVGIFAFTGPMLVAHVTRKLIVFLIAVVGIATLVAYTLLKVGLVLGAIGLVIWGIRALGT